MINTIRLSNRVKRERNGAILPLIAIFLPLLILLMAYVINIAHLELGRTELQISADAAARAGGRTLADTSDLSLARSKARELAVLNPVGSKPLDLSDSDIVFGVSTRTGAGARYDFNPTGTQFNAVRVTAQRSPSNSDGPYDLLFPDLLNVANVNLSSVSTSTQVEMDIALVVDRSGSMAYASDESSNTFDNPAAAPSGWAFGDQVPTPSRWEDAENAVAAFLVLMNQTAQTELVSLATYGDNASIDVQLTANYTDILNSMSQRGQNFLEASTNIGGGIDDGLQSLTSSPNARSFATKVILVLTDGIHNTGTSPNSAANRAIDENTIVFTITFSVEADQTRMQTVANIGKGKHFHANSSAQLVSAFEEIAKSLPTLLVE